VSDPALTPLEIERAVDVLSRERAIRREPWDADQLNRIFGRSARPLRSTLRQLSALGLLAFDRDGRWGLTRTGTEVLDARAARDWGPITALTLRAGHLERDLLAFLGEAETHDGHACLLCARARTIAPALAAVIAWQPAWRRRDHFVVPLDALQLAMVGAAMEIADGRPDWVEGRERVGHRAEAYSLRVEREEHGPGAILHVSRDEGDRFGYDLEDVSIEPSRLIECKGSRATALSFVMSANELAVAGEHPDRYEIHYWGGVDLGRTPDEDFAALREAGYPTVIRDPAGAIERGEFSANAEAWKVRARGEAPVPLPSR
jgi:hypothetical protein